MADVKMAGMQKAMLAAIMGEFKTAKQTNPPISTGMADTMAKLQAILLAQRVVTPEEYSQVTSLNISSVLTAFDAL